MIVSMWMTRNVVTVQPQTSASQAAGLMSTRRIRRLPVVDGPHIVGIVSARDILHAFPPGVNPFAVLAPAASAATVTVEHIMARHPQTIEPDAPIEAAAALMAERKIGALPVVRAGNLVGLITESDIFRGFVGIFTSPHNTARITFDISSGEDVFGWISQETRRRELRVTSLISTRQEDLPVCVVRVAGHSVDEFLEDLWNSGHRVLNVLRSP
jgi:acetoin utilization protein AcuB